MINTTNQENITQQQRKVWQIHPSSQKHKHNLQNPQKNPKKSRQGGRELELTHPNRN